MVLLAARPQRDWQPRAKRIDRGMPMPIRNCPALDAAFILQDRKRLPARFFGAFSGTMLSRLS